MTKLSNWGFPLKLAPAGVVFELLLQILVMDERQSLLPDVPVPVPDTGVPDGERGSTGPGVGGRPKDDGILPTFASKLIIERSEFQVAASSPRSRHGYSPFTDTDALSGFPWKRPFCCVGAPRSS